MYVYLLEYRQLNRTTNRFELYNTDVFSSKFKLEQTVSNSIEVNKGTDIDVNGFTYADNYKTIVYNCLSTDNRPMRLKYSLYKKRVQ